MEQQVLAGRYALGPRVGTGGMAEVFEAHDTRLGRDVAVKLFRAGAADGIERGSAEARLLAGLDHPGLVRVLDMDTGEQTGERAYLVMELVRGPDLHVLLRGTGPLGREDVRRLALDLVRTLEYIHGQGIVHRDIKPSNILTRPPEQYGTRFGHLLTDFGIARFFDGGRMTATGLVIGSVAYFSPEQARGDDVGRASDIYSLGLVLIECLTGEKAFPGTGMESALVRLHRAPSIPHAAGPGLAAVLMSMTMDDPAARPTAAALVRSLTALGPLQPGAVAQDRQESADDDATAASPAVSPVASRTADSVTAPSPADDSPTAASPTTTVAPGIGATSPATSSTTAPEPAAPSSPRPELSADEPETEALTRSASVTRALATPGTRTDTRAGAPDADSPPRALPAGAPPTAAFPATAELRAGAGSDADGLREHRTPEAASSEPAATRKPGRGGRRALLLVVALVALLVIAIGVWSSGVLELGSGTELLPLPAVPGEPGDRLQELYESVQP